MLFTLCSLKHFDIVAVRFFLNVRIEAGALAIALYPAWTSTCTARCHCAANGALAAVLQGLVVARRCAFAGKSTRFLPGERAVMCTPDWDL